MTPLPLKPMKPAPTPTTPTRGRRLLIGLATAAAVAGPLAVIGMSGLELIARPATGLAAAPGESHDGLPLRDRQVPIGGPLLRVRADAPADRPAGDAAALTLRQGCAWGQPGRQPYRGTTEQALSAAGLPSEVVQQIAAQRLAGRKSGRLEISRHAIRQVDGPGRFNPRSMAMSFGLTLCLHTRVNFAPGHVEPADLYEARDATGRLHAVMVPDVCGNVTVLGVRGPGGVVAGVAGALTQRSEALATVAEALAADADPGDRDADVAVLQHGDGSADLGGGAGSGGSASAARPVAAPGVALAAGPAIGAAGGPAARAVGGRGAEGGVPVVPLAHGRGAVPASLSSPRIDVVLWQGLRSSTLPRQVSTGGLKRVADGLARGGEMVRTLAAVPPDGDPPASGPGEPPFGVTRQVPEPGSLACVLVALVAAWWGGRRRLLRRR